MSGNEPAGDAGRSLRERVAAREGSLSASERRVAHYLSDFPDEVAFASAEALGVATGTSDATVIRTVKALGYPGLLALKRVLQESVKERLTPADRLSHSLDVLGTEPGQVLARVLDDSSRLLEQARRTISERDFAEAVTLLGGARESVIVAAGGLGVLGQYLALRLTRLGHRARAAVASGFMLADDLLPLGPEDVLVVISHQTTHGEIDVALAQAAMTGAKVLLLTDTLGEALADRVTVSLSAPVGNTEMFSVQATTLTIIEALALAVAARDSAGALRSMSEMNRIRAELRRHAAADSPGPGSARRARTRRPAPPGAG